MTLVEVGTDPVRAVQRINDPGPQGKGLTSEEVANAYINVYNLIEEHYGKSWGLDSGAWVIYIAMKIEGELTESDRYLDHDCRQFCNFTADVTKNTRSNISSRNVWNS